MHGHRYKLSVLLPASAQQPSVRRARCHQLKRGALQRWCHEGFQLVPRADIGNRVDYQNNLISMQHSVTLQSGHQTSQLLVLFRHQYIWTCARRSTQVRQLPKQICQGQVGSKHCSHGRAAIYIACSSSSGAFVDQAPHSNIEVSKTSQYVGIPVLNFLRPLKLITAVQIPANQQGYRHAILHDFCMGIPYGSIVLAAGLVSLLFGSGHRGIAFAAGGTAILASAFFSLVQWRAQRPSTMFTLGSAGRLSWAGVSND